MGLKKVSKRNEHPKGCSFLQKHVQKQIKALGHPRIAGTTLFLCIYYSRYFRVCQRLLNLHILPGDVPFPASHVDVHPAVGQNADDIKEISFGHLPHDLVLSAGAVAHIDQVSGALANLVGA